jgi:hypothetical protein
MRGALSPDGTRAVGYDQHGSGEIALWNVESGQLMGRLKPPRRSISGADGPGLRMVRFTKDGQGLRALQRDGATLHFAADALMKRCQQRRRASLYITASRASTPRSSGVATGRPGRGAQSLITPRLYDVQPIRVAHGGNLHRFAGNALAFVALHHFPELACSLEKVENGFRPRIRLTADSDLIARFIQVSDQLRPGLRIRNA